MIFSIGKKSLSRAIFKQKRKGKKLTQMEELITLLRSEYDQLKAQVAELTAFVEQLKAEMRLLKNRRNSKTS
jgi:molecular chaperone GrpE (heat shock protein)